MDDAACLVEYLLDVALRVRPERLELRSMLSKERRRVESVCRDRAPDRVVGERPSEPLLQLAAHALTGEEVVDARDGSP